MTFFFQDNPDYQKMSAGDGRMPDECIKSYTTRHPNFDKKNPSLKHLIKLSLHSYGGTNPVVSVKPTSKDLSVQVVWPCQTSSFIIGHATSQK